MPEGLGRFVYGLPERCRNELTGATHASGVGCNASATILALGPLADEGLLDRVVADIKVGSSEAGGRPSESSHHPERSGAIRSFKPTGHRHQAEVFQALGSDFDGIPTYVEGLEDVEGEVGDPAEGEEPAPVEPDFIDFDNELGSDGTDDTQVDGDENADDQP